VQQLGRAGCRLSGAVSSGLQSAAAQFLYVQYILTHTEIGTLLRLLGVRPKKEIRKFIPFRFSLILQVQCS
jgi:hypothetical protein